MSNEKSIVITAYGHNRTIDKIAVCSFDDYHHHDGKLNAEIYCNTINSLELKGDDWVFAKIVSENTQYPADVLFPLRFDIITTLHDRAIQKVLREVDAQVIAIALKGESEALKETIFKNMSKRAAEMLKEDMEFMGPLRLSDVKESQKRILDIIRHLEQTGEIVISYQKGEFVE